MDPWDATGATVVLALGAMVGLGCSDDGDSGATTSTSGAGAGGEAGAGGTTMAGGGHGGATAAGGQGGQPSGGAGGAGGGTSHKTSLSVCWLEPACHRALIVSHGGDWAPSGPPFLSMTGFEQAHAKGADGIELDVRLTQDQVAVVAHSSPIEIYESWDCSGQRIEEMTAAEVTSCHLGVSLLERFQRLDDVLSWAAGKLIIELDVKESGDLPGAVATVIAQHAEDRSFIHVSVDEITNTIPTIPSWQSAHYLVNIADPAQVPAMLSIAASHNVFMFEMDRSYSGYSEAQVTELLVNTVVPGGVKGFASSDTLLPTIQNHKDVFHQTFDVVLSYNCHNGVQAAVEINAERAY